MTTDPNILLHRLQPAVRPTYAGGTGGAPKAPLEQQPFDELLVKASQGLIASGRSVTAGDAVASPLTDDELTHLAAAADQAEASGAQRALLVMDGRGLVLDVAARTLTAEVSAGTATPVTGIDTAVFVAGTASESAPLLLPPPAGVAPPAVGRQLDAASQRPSTAA
jgi:hypothetical protein